MELDLTAHGRGAYVVVTVRGELDMATAPQLRDFLCDIVHTRNAQVIVDLSEVGFMDSSGLAVLIGIRNRTHAAEGSLLLAAPSTQVQRRLATTGLHTLLPSYPTIEAATETQLPGT